MKELFLAIQARLSAMVPALAFIDFDLSQLSMEPLPPLSYPAALIRFTASDPVSFGNDEQKQEMLITVSLAFRTFERTSNLTPDDFRNVGVQHLDNLDLAKWALHGFSGTSFSSITNTGQEQTDRADLRVYQLFFTTTLTTNRPGQEQFVQWNTAGGTGVGPDLCIQDDEGPLIPHE